MAKMKSKSSGSSKSQKKEFRKGKKSYESVFCGISEYGLYVGLANGEGDDREVEFISKYEAVGFLNSLLEQFDSVEVEFGKETSQKGVDYETCTPIDYEIGGEEE